MTAAVRALLAALYTPLLIVSSVPPVTALTLLLVPLYSWQGPVLAFVLGGACGALGGIVEDRVLDWAAPRLTPALTPTLPPTGGENDGHAGPATERLNP